MLPTIDSIMFSGIEHSKPMPVNGRAVPFQVILDRDF